MQYRSKSLFPAYLPALRDPVMQEGDPFFEGQKTSELFARDITKIPALNRTPYWTEANTYLEQALSHWAASGMENEGFLSTLEQKLQRRLDLEVSPSSISRLARQ
jgi:lactose/L-arabinose transport system substrate-binding protein